MIDVDVETTSLAHHGGKPCFTFLAQFGDESTEAKLHYLDDRGDVPTDVAREQIQDWLSRGGEYEAWNTKFDMHCLRQAGFNLPDDRGWNDGMVRAYILDERPSAALQERANRLFGDDAHPEYEVELRKWLQTEDKRRRKVSKETGEEFVHANYGDVPRELMDKYGAQDIINTRGVRGVYKPQVESNPHFQHIYDLEMDVMRALFWAEDRGIPVDREALVACEADILPRMEQYEDEAIALSEFKGLNVRSDKQIGESLERLGANVSVMDRTAKTKQLKVDQENLEAVNHPFADAILRYRGEEKTFEWLTGALHGPTAEATRKKFPGSYLTAENRLHPNFRQIGAKATGRMSCANPNFQNIPRDDLRLRYAIKADPGKKLIACDLDSIELRLLALFAGKGAINEAVQRGEDLHALTAERVGLTGRKRASGDMESPRDQGKRLNYLIVYGGGMNAVKKWFGVSRDRARQILDQMHRAYPEVTDLQSRIEWKLEERGYLECPLDMRRWRMYGSGYAAVQKEGYRFINYLIQGTAAVILKIAMAKLHKDGVHLIAAIHDELLAHEDASDAVEVAHTIQEAMTHGFEMVKDGRMMEEIVPITAEAQIVDRWSDAKKKGYVPAYAV